MTMCGKYTLAPAMFPLALLCRVARCAKGHSCKWGDCIAKKNMPDASGRLRWRYRPQIMGRSLHVSWYACHKNDIVFVTRKDGEMGEQKAIAELLSGAKPGEVFVPSDFAEVGSADSVRKALSRLVKAGELERPMRGIYRKPRYSAFLDKEVPASPDEIAEALARKFEWCIAPYGDTALNRLGIDSQVPSVGRYVSDGPYRTYQYGPYTIEFQHTANRDLSRLSPVAATVVQALKALGKDGVTQDKLDTISSRLDDSQMEKLTSETRNATSWVRTAIRDMQKRRPQHA